MVNRTEPDSGVKPLDVLQITDTHLLHAEQATLNGIPTAASLSAVLEAALQRQPDPDLIVATGDLVHDGSVTGYRRLEQWLARTEVPSLVIPGNHDDPDVMSQCFTTPPVLWQVSQRIGPWQVESLNSCVPGQAGGRLGAEQLAALSARLYAGDGPVLVAVHHPPVAIGAAWLDRIRLEDGESLMGCLARTARPAVVICGHAHQGWAHYADNTMVLGTPATCFQFAPWMTDFALDDRQPGWRWLRLHPNGIVDTGVGRLDEDWLPATSHA